MAKFSHQAVLWTVALFTLFSRLAVAQESIPLPITTPSPASMIGYPEKQYFSKAWNTEIVADVTKPSLLVFKPTAELKNGTAAIVCPGGGFMALSINSEGIEVAKFLASKGVTAFVLKYRLAQTADDASLEFGTLWATDRPKLEQMIHQTAPLSFADGLEALTYVKQHAAEFGIAADRVGIIGFSAGGAVTAWAAYHYTPESRPAFVAPIYAGGLPAGLTVPADAPPMFIAAASDDGLGLVPQSLALYNDWLKAKKPVELHLYTKGGHGFGMKKQNIPTDEWPEQFAEWLQLEGFLNK
jgi:acetyl esterase/lipase